jgi:hypothetical protein
VNGLSVKYWAWSVCYRLTDSNARDTEPIGTPGGEGAPFNRFLPISKLPSNKIRLAHLKHSRKIDRVISIAILFLMPFCWIPG